MIKLNTIYSIDNGANSIIFTEGKKDSVTGTHNEGTLTGFIEGNVLRGTFHNVKVNATGLIEVTFHENGFEAKWKNGMEPGPMRGKWVGELFVDLNNLKQNNGYNLFLQKSDIETHVLNLINASQNEQKEFSIGLFKFVQENTEYLWLLPCYDNIIQSFEYQIDNEEISGSINGFLWSKDCELVPQKLFSNKSLYFDLNEASFSYQPNEETDNLFNLLLSDLNLSKIELTNSFKFIGHEKGSEPYYRLVNLIRTSLYATIVKAYYSSEYSNFEIAQMIVAPLNEQELDFIISLGDMDNFGDDVLWAIEDVLFCFGIDVNDQNYDSDWNQFSKDYEKMAEDISDKESYDNALIRM
jgi:hypothetical protein